ncbi:MAG: hypothetical protein ABIH26_02325 [Candidatus Eisenbacteria bacterium]
MAKQRRKRSERERPAEAHQEKGVDEKDEIDFPTVVWSLVILAVLVVLHRLIWGG